jgi:hypothetical protein
MSSVTTATAGILGLGQDLKKLSLPAVPEASSSAAAEARNRKGDGDLPPLSTGLSHDLINIGDLPMSPPKK